MSEQEHVSLDFIKRLARIELELMNMQGIFQYLRKKGVVLRFALAGKRKQSAEIDFWYHEILSYVKWYTGKIPHLYGIPPPAQEEKIVGYSLEENAIHTWAIADIQKYPKHLMIPRNYFADKRLLDVGCGPIPCALAFTDCEIWGLDQLIDSFKEIGYPLDSYSNRITYLKGSVEKIPIEDNFFDAVISVNAIDHVDNFPEAAREICRVLRPSGTLLMEVHYECMHGLKRFTSAHLQNFIHPIHGKKNEKLTVWSNTARHTSQRFSR